MANDVRKPNGSILIVEDDVVIALDLEQRVKAFGYRCCGRVSNGEAAIEAAARERPDLVLMDIVLSGELDGIEAADRIKNTFGIPIVFITSYADDERLKRARLTMPFGYVLKPFQDNSLKITIEMAIYVAQADAQRRKTERELLRIKEEWERTFDTVSDLILIIDNNYHIIKINKAAAQAINIAPEEAVGRKCHEVLHNLPTAPDFCMHSKVLKEGKEYRNEFGDHHLGSDFSLTMNPWFDDRGRIMGTVHVLRDITERKQAEHALKASHDTLVTVLDSLVADIYVADIETHKILFMNRHMKESFGRDLVGKICHEAFRAESHPCEYCTNNRLFDAEGRPAGVIIWDDRNPITGRWYMNYDQAVRWVDGRYVRLQVAMDITDIKIAELDREKLETQLRQSQKMEAMGSLAGGIAHDFNNILGAIVGYTELTLLDLDAANPAYENLTQALKAASRARSLVKQILTFSRQTEQQLNPIDVGPIIKEALKFLRSSLPSTIEIKQNIQSSAGTILADPTQIHQILMNLSTNAAHAMRNSGGVLDVKLKEIFLDPEDSYQLHKVKPGRYLHISVSDTGEGMDSETATRVFEPYFTTKKQEEGTGLGLAVVHGIVQNSGGTIRVYSEKGHGTTFHLYFPFVGWASGGESTPAGMILGGSERVLLIDDEKDIVDISRQMLERLGYQVESYMNSREALATFLNQPSKFDLVLTDQTMPYLTGADLAREILNLRPDIPIIICTGFSETITADQAEKIGIRAFLMKPIILQELAATIRSVLDDG